MRDELYGRLYQIFYHINKAGFELDLKCNDNAIREEVAMAVRKVLDDYKANGTISKDRLRELINVLDDAINKVDNLSNIPQCRTFFVKWQYEIARDIVLNLLK